MQLRSPETNHWAATSIMGCLLPSLGSALHWGCVWGGVGGKECLVFSSAVLAPFAELFVT